MALIRKRLKVEMWMYDHLQLLFTNEVRKLVQIVSIFYSFISSGRVKVKLC